MGEAPGHVSTRLCGFRGVLGEVAGDHLVGNGAVAGDADRSDVELVAPFDEPGHVELSVGFGDEACVPGGVIDRVDQVAEADPVGYRGDGLRVGRVDAVEADDGMEVDDAAPLHLGDLAVRDPDGCRVDSAATQRADQPVRRYADGFGTDHAPTLVTRRVTG
jgi:hypothetical protein